MLSTIYSVSALLFSFAVLSLGHGLHNTLLTVRATMENYPEWVTGVMASGYFLGSILGALYCTKIIPKIGQIRAFAAFASIASAISLFHVLYINEFSWIVLRVAYGFCVAALYMVIESWLNSLSTKQNRGRILSTYLTINFLCLSAGQMFIFIAEPSEYVLFAVVSVLISVSLVPLTLSKTKQPDVMSSEHLSFKELFKTSPLATVGCVAVGLTSGAFWGLGAVYFTQIGLNAKDVALLISLTFLGGLIFQWPIGLCSDYFDRRKVIAVVMLGFTLITGAFAFFVDEHVYVLNNYLMILSFFLGGCAYTLYSLFISLANDFLQPKHVVKASAGLIIFHAVGAIIGPFLASLMMASIGAHGLFLYMMTINAVVFLFSIMRIMHGRGIPEATSENFVSMPKTSMGVMDLDPRQEDREENLG
jgi:MFS family permease